MSGRNGDGGGDSFRTAAVTTTTTTGISSPPPPPSDEKKKYSLRGSLVSNISTVYDDHETNEKESATMMDDDDDDGEDECVVDETTPERRNEKDSSDARMKKNSSANNEDEAFSPNFQPVPSQANTPMNAFQQRDQRYEMEDARNGSMDRESTSPMVFGRRGGAENQSDASNGQDFLAHTKNREDDSAKASPDAKSEEEEDLEAGANGMANGGEMEDENVQMKSPLAFLFQNKRRKGNNKNATPKEYDRDSYRHGAMWASIGSPAFPHKNQSRVMNANTFNSKNNIDDASIGVEDGTNNVMNDTDNKKNNKQVEFEDATDSFGGSAGKATDFGVDEKISNRNRAKMRMSLPANLAQSVASPLPISKRVLDRIECLGPELARVQKIMLLTGILLDFWGKFSLIRELRRFSVTASWLWFSLVLIFFLISGCLTTSYWLLHYPMPEKPAKDDKEANAVVFGYTKYDFKVFVRRFGAVCAACQLGTAFAAWRALRSHDVRQRKAEMDLRGMQLVDCIFLSLPVATLQCYIGMMCSSPYATCPDRSGFDYVLFSAVAGGLLSGTLCFVSLDLHEKPPAYSWREYWGIHKAHLSEMLAKFNFRFFELTARVVTIGLFASVCGAWVFLVFFVHILCIIGLMRIKLSGVPDRTKIWSKFVELKDVELPFQSAKRIAKNGGKKKTIRIPVLDDVKLLVACLIWPPSCFVSNSTDKKGRFWWRSTTCPRKTFWGLTREDALIPFVLILMLFALENGTMLVVVTHVAVDHWYRYLGMATFMNFIWLSSAVIWISSAALWNPFTPKGPPLAYPSANVAAPENYRLSSISSFKDKKSSMGGRRSGIRPLARRSRAWVSPTASPVVEADEVVNNDNNVAYGENIGEKFNAAAATEATTTSPISKYDTRAGDEEMAIARSPEVIVDINNTTYKVEDSAGEEEEEDMESYETNEPSAFACMIDRTGEDEMLRRSLQWQRASEEMLKSVTDVKMKAESDLAAARAAMNFLNRESVESAQGDTEKKYAEEEQDEDEEEEEEEEELNRTMSSDAYIESMQKGRMKNEVTGDAYVDAIRSPGGSIASDGNSPLGKMNSMNSPKEQKEEPGGEEEEEEEEEEEVADPWGFDEKKLKIDNSIDNDDDFVNNESPKAFPSRSNSGALRALETPMFSPVAEQPKYAKDEEDEDEEKKQPKFSPRLTRAQSRAQRSAKYFK
jgi:hypothetical protein